jgi:CubicO group peptidase (beta-lactamase class C family)
MRGAHRSIRITAALLGLIALFCLPSPLAAEEDHDISGKWNGAIKIPGTELGVIIEFTQSDSGWVGTIDIPMQSAKGLALSGISVEANDVSFKIDGVPGDPSFSGTIADDTKAISGDFSQAGQVFPFELSRVDAATEAAAAGELQEKLRRIRDFVDSTKVYWKVPGASLAIVKDGEVIFADGIGYRDVKDSLPVTSQTLFAIGSSTKAFTTMALGILADEGLVEWDKPVRTYLPDFELYDEYSSEHLTPRDLVTHRSGLPRHDLMWYNSDFTREQLYHRLRYLEPNKEPRTTFQYQNLMFMTAGYLVGQVSGSTWEDFVGTRIFKPLGMINSNFSVLESQKSSDYALPYDVVDDTLKQIPFREINSMGPAGSINSCADDMAKWLLLHLNKGKVGDEQIVSEANLSQMHAPQIVLGSESRYDERLLASYGMGWFIEAYRGHLLNHHGGNIDGFSAQEALLPNENIGVSVLTNLNGNPLPDIVAFYVIDELLDLEPIEWQARSRVLKETAEAATDTAKAEVVDHVKGTKPSHKLEEFVGDYENPGYGIISVNMDGKKLKAVYNKINLPLEHWHYDVFKAEAKDVPGEPKLMFTFLTNVIGDIDRLRVPMDVSVDEIEFTRRPEARMFTPEFLSQFTGKYDVVGQEMEVTLKGDSTLIMTAMGQPPYELVPYKGYQFELKDLTGFSIEFVLDKDGVVTGMDIHQPNAVYIATKK